tara:strand:- start:440 stop:739 length:300 start_codon:yes stop_codon:yes gene_type:complete
MGLKRISRRKKLLTTTFLILASLFSIAESANANYWLVIGSYRQGPGSKAHVSGITSPSLFAIPTDTLQLCQEAGRKISNEIYKPVWQFDNKWTCIYSGK